ncbi:hypothetical protein [Paenibacillus sp. TSA_86.1]|uniref:hypothetical protein n=1 Tax=Paenibacillus sp. TSA_86.1 TaxID=3415649 RepID=UPI004045D68C
MSSTSITVINPPTINNLINNLNLVQVKTTEIINNFNQMNQINLNQFNQTNIANHFNQVNQQMNVTINLMEKLEDAADDTTDKLGDNLSKLSKWLQMIKSAGSIVLKAAAEEEDFKYRYMVAAQDPVVGEGVYHKFRDQASKKGQDVNDSLKASLGYLPMAQNTGQVEQLNDLTARLSMLSPDGKSLSDASGAIQSAMNGDDGDLTSQFGISESALSGAGLEGFIQTKDLDGFIQGLQTVLEMQGYTQEAFDTMLDSPLQKWTALVNQFNGILSEIGTKALEVLSPVLDRLNEAMSSGQFSGFIEWIGGAFAIIAQVIAFIVDGFINFATAVQASWDIIAPILTAIAMVLLYNMIVSLGIVIGEVFLLAVAWLAVNWPILLIIAAIAILIMVFQMFGATGTDILGAIIGTFMMFGEMIRVVIATVWNIFASLADFLINLFIDPVYAIQKLFYDLGMFVLQTLYNVMVGIEDFLKRAVGAISEVASFINDTFGTNLSVISESDINIGSKNIKSWMDALKSVEPQSDKNVFKSMRMDGEYNTNAYGEGQKYAEDWTAKFTSKPKDSSVKDLPGKFGKDFMPETPKTPPMPPMPTAPAPANMNNMSNLNKINNIGQVDKIGDVAGTVDVTSEDLKLMRELAEMQAIQRFVSLTPTVQVTTGDINSGHDVDSIISKITEEMNSQIVSGAQGVYG